MNVWRCRCSVRPRAPGRGMPSLLSARARTGWVITTRRWCTFEPHSIFARTVTHGWRVYSGRAWSSLRNPAIHEIERLLTAGLQESPEFALPLARLLLSEGLVEEGRAWTEWAGEAEVYGAALLLGNLLSETPDSTDAAEAAYWRGIATGDAHSGPQSRGAVAAAGQR